MDSFIKGTTISKMTNKEKEVFTEWKESEDLKKIEEEIYQRLRDGTSTFSQFLDEIMKVKKERIRRGDL